MQSQTRIDSYFSANFPTNTVFNISKRVMNAIHKADFGGDAEADNNDDGNLQQNETGKIYFASLLCVWIN